MRVTITSLTAVLITCASVMSAGVPNTINYQGKLTNAAGGAVPDGSIQVKFQIYDAATGGSVLWNSLFQTVNTVNGLFSYDLGSNVILPDLFGSDSIRYLGISVNTDPEFSPRTRFTSTGYVFRSLKSDIALDADSLGGLQPSFYLDWANMTSIPAGFTDGVDDEGISQTMADGRYVNTTGDVISGNLSLQSAGVDRITLEANGGNGVNIFRLGSGGRSARLWGPSVGELQLWDDRNPPVNSVDMFAAGTGGTLFLKDTNGTSTIALIGNATGANSVVVPDNAISSSEMLDEPGIASNVKNIVIPLIGTTMSDIVKVTITIPVNGYINIVAQCRASHSGTTGKNFGFFQIDEDLGGIWIAPYFVGGGATGFASAGQNDHSIFATRVYFKTAGTYTFRLEGMMFTQNDAGAQLTADNSIITATFFPTSYGSVITVAGQPGDHPTAKAVSVTNPDGTVTTGYKMDLRYYEEKARQAEITAQKAELDKLQAQSELERALQSNNKD